MWHAYLVRTWTGTCHPRGTRSQPHPGRLLHAYPVRTHYAGISKAAPLMRGLGVTSHLAGPIWHAYLVRTRAGRSLMIMSSCVVQTQFAGRTVQHTLCVLGMHMQGRTMSSSLGQVVSVTIPSRSRDASYIWTVRTQYALTRGGLTTQYLISTSPPPSACVLGTHKRFTQLSYTQPLPRHCAESPGATGWYSLACVPRMQLDWDMSLPGTKRSR